MKKRKQTGGGTFDKSESPIYYIATGADTHRRANARSPYVLIAVNELKSDSDMELLEELIGRGFKVFLDSGIFNLTNEHARKYDVAMDDALALAPTEIEGFEKLWDRYIDIVTRYADGLWGFIELDQGGAVNKRKTRARIEKETGLIPIPVYHPLNDGWDYFDELVGEYDRICFGNIVQARTPVRKRLLTTLYERQRKVAPDVWVHVLGFTPNEWVGAIPWYGSADSSSWTRNLRWSSSHKSYGMCKTISNFPRTMVYEYDAPDSYNKAIEFGAVQGGTFLSRTWRALQEERAAL